MRQLSVMLVVFTMTAPAARVFAEDVPGKPCNGRSRSQGYVCPLTVGPLQAAALQASTRLGANLIVVPRTLQSQPPPSSSQRSWARRHPALLGALIGLGVGVGLAATTEDCRYAGNGDSFCGAYVGLYGGIGAGLGSAIGFGISR